ncbi:MAG: pilus assembly protein TadG-related protein, partial [Geminicoccaceae bacterium]
MQGPGVNGFFNKLCVVFDLSWRNEERHVKAASAETGESSNSLAVDAATAKAFCSGSARHCFAPDCSIVAGCNRGRALAVDVARAYSLKSDLQATADAAALAAAIMLPDIDEARQAANRAVRMNLPAYPGILRADDLEFGQWQAASSSILMNDNAASAVRVTVRRTESRGNGVETLFAGVLGEEMMDVASSAVAGKRGVACLIALDPSGKGLELKSNAELELKACGAQINSTDKQALKASGKSTLISDSICISGGAKVDGNAEVVPVPSEYCPPQIDPMTELVTPEIGGCTDTDVEYKDETITLT